MEAQGVKFLSDDEGLELWIRFFLKVCPERFSGRTCLWNGRLQTSEILYLDPSLSRGPPSLGEPVMPLRIDLATQVATELTHDAPVVQVKGLKLYQGVLAGESVLLESKTEA